MIFVWWIFGGNCGFSSSLAGSLAAPTDCENAGGAYSGSCTIDASSCKSVGGKWGRCIFDSDQCATFTAGTGTTWIENPCEYTESSCNSSAGGSWDATEKDCDFSGNHCPGTNCSHTTKSACESDKGTWADQCKFNNATACTSSLASNGAGSSLYDTNKPNSCVFAESECIAASGIKDSSNCYLTHKEGETNIRYFPSDCETNFNGQWNPATKNVCLKVFYRNSITNQITSFESKSKTIKENGGYQTITFEFLSSPSIPIGKNAIGIYEHDGSTCTTTLYPYDRTEPIPIAFIPYADLPIINW